jgi:hypothetical protein
MVKKPFDELQAIAYAANELKNSNTYSKVYKEIFRRINPPENIPEKLRPEMPIEAKINNGSGKLIQDLIKKIYMGSEAKKQEAYHKFIEIYLTDWIDREGFIKNGKEYKYEPFFNDLDFLKELREYINKQLFQCEERPNPKSIDKKVGNSTRQQLLKDLRDKISDRITFLISKKYYKSLKSNGGKRNITYKHIKNKRYNKLN